MTARHPLHEHLQAGREARLACRTGQITGATAKLASGHVQGNLAILPEKLAAAFHRFCQLNPKPCPIIGISEAGNPGIPSLGIDLDVRTDLPRYRVWCDGKLIEEPTDIAAHWRDDLVAFVGSGGLRVEPISRSVLRLLRCLRRRRREFGDRVTGGLRAPLILTGVIVLRRRACCSAPIGRY
jgi:hypothetical protein